MTRRPTTLTLVIGVLIGLGLAQLLPTAQAESPEATIKTDGAVIRFMVDGQEKARIDGAGLHVNGDVAYAGVSIDTVTYLPIAPQAGAP